MDSQVRKFVLTGIALAAVAGLAACGPKSTPPPPPPPPPAPPPVVYIPPRPLPPLGAAASLVVPPIGLDGTRRTINSGITPAQTLWNFRSAYNVAALNCMKPEHAEILTGYKKFLITHKKALTTANKAVDGDFRKRHGTAFIRPREAYMTQVYNFYAFPPTVAKFCDAALLMARESMTLKPADLQAFSVRNLAMFDGVFETFYKSYDQYRADAAAWDARYAPAAPIVTPAPGAVPAGTQSLPAPSPSPATGR